MPARSSFVGLLAASFLAFQPTGPVLAAPAKPGAAKPKPAKPAAKPPAAKPAPRPKAPTPIPGLRVQEAGDALVEPVGTTPELQGDQQFTNTINWTKRVITVLGIGIAPDRGTLGTRRTLAKSYALEDGLRQMAEVVDKVRVNADAYVRDYTVSDDDIRAKVNQRIRASKIVDTHILADGSVELKLQMPLYTKEGLAGAVVRDEPSPIQFAADATLSLPVTQWTGIIVDARGTGAQPALVPSLRSVEGAGLPDRPSVAYTHTREGASDLAGDKPLSFKVKRAAGQTKADLLLETADFGKLRDALGRGGLSVVIIL
jgi:hypothetical protein